MALSARSLWVDGGRTEASPVPHRVVETHGHAISILFSVCTSFTCNTYIVLTWNKIKSGPGASSSSDWPHTRIPQNRRQGQVIEDQSQVQEQLTSSFSVHWMQLF
ncbi:small integral membrane protein 2 [Pipistrellus kuhlii]|uniref:small integral membrane protein 2 n=1 Tax=Pipistrellus kuhlii TaxID=59472 RepID=UPI001E2715F8|nr:small integral membrane protein 2 [Pipistrellus kuhlii]